jgi:hypothetical protein
MPDPSEQRDADKPAGRLIPRRLIISFPRACVGMQSRRASVAAKLGLSAQTGSHAGAWEPEKNWAVQTGSHAGAWEPEKKNCFGNSAPRISRNN